MAKKSRRTKPARVPYVRRPFAGLVGECDIVAMREFVPSATAAVTVRGHEDRDVALCTLLPGAAPALVRDDGTVWLGLQVRHAFRDPSRDLAAVLSLALAAPHGNDVVLTSDPGEGDRLQNLLVEQPLAVEVSPGFEFWGVADQQGAEEIAAMAAPTVRLASVDAAYWTGTAGGAGGRAFLRWAMPHDEDLLLDALARLHVAGRDGLVEGARLIGMFRAHGILAPVWELEPGTGADAVEAPAAAVAAAIEETLADPTALNAAERAARAGLANRQVTLR